MKHLAAAAKTRPSVHVGVLARSPQAARDECVALHGPESKECAPLIEAHKLCLRAEGFNVSRGVQPARRAAAACSLLARGQPRHPPPTHTPRTRALCPRSEPRPLRAGWVRTRGEGSLRAGAAAGVRAA